MSRLKRVVLAHAPYWFQDLAITIYNKKLYHARHSGAYTGWRAYYRGAEKMDAEAVASEASRRLAAFLEHASKRSAWYRDFVGARLDQYPVLEKADLINNLDIIATIGAGQAKVSLTGGTTGASMKVYYTPENGQERFALLDHFRESFGYRLGEKVAWFSGKPLASQLDVQRGRCYRDDLLNKIRFFSTFHITRQNFDSYWRALEEFKPRFMVGFPSSMYDIAVLAQEKGLRASYEVRAVFPTAETLLPVHREVIGSVFNTRLVNQYASSEGAPFILECSEGRLHMHPLSGVFEVVGLDGAPAMEGELLVTSFTTYGTPLIRYRIGDRIKLAEPGTTCVCGSVFPMVDFIDGRTTDCVWSPENGRITAVNLSNSTKNVLGLVSFQVLQDEMNSFSVNVLATDDFDSEQERAFIAALRDRVGDRMDISLARVDEIPREPSGKFRIVKSSIASSVHHKSTGR